MPDIEQFSEHSTILWQTRNTMPKMLELRRGTS